MIFQGFFVFATLLTTGIGGFAVPVRRQSTTGTFTLRNTVGTNTVCIDAGPDTEGTIVTFENCNGQATQTWGASTGVSQIKSQGGFCLGITSSLIQLQDCDDSNQEWLVDPDPEVIGTLDTNICMTNDGSGQVAAEGCITSDDASQIISAVPVPQSSDDTSLA